VFRYPWQLPVRLAACVLVIETACRLFREKGLKVSTVARMVGLKDVSQFIADFRRETGQTPAAYREAHRQ
jgi:AraC-like DNA-binding protein